MTTAMMTMGMSVEFLAHFGAIGGCRGLRCRLVAICITLMTFGPAYSPPANAEEAEQIAAKTEIDDGTSQESVLVSFTLSAPDGVEAEIAKEHNLELVSKLPLPTLGIRVVRYAVPDSRPIAAVLARLRADQRVSSAQVNVQYRQIEPDVPEAVVGSVPSQPNIGPRKSAARKSVVRREAPVFGPRRPVRSARISVGDVLAGGL
jgi:hypothetical protein